MSERTEGENSPPLLTSRCPECGYAHRVSPGAGRVFCSCGAEHEKLPKPDVPPLPPCDPRCGPVAHIAGCSQAQPAVGPVDMDGGTLQAIAKLVGFITDLTWQFQPDHFDVIFAGGGKATIYRDEHGDTRVRIEGGQ